MRKTIQALSLLLFTALFLLATYRLPDWLPADIYLRIDPLLGITAVIASREFIVRVLWSLLLVGATLVVGRFFCAYVCPLGASIDFLDVLLFRKGKRRGLNTDTSLRRWKYYLLTHRYRCRSDRRLPGLSGRPDRPSDAVLYPGPLPR